MSKTWSIQFEGVVQGVGFRPHFLKQSHLFNIPIQIGNTTTGVELLLNAENKDQAVDLVNQLLENLPQQAKIRGINIQETVYNLIEKSKIIYPESQVTDLYITPDFSWCNHCKEEFNQVENRRYNFLFISCTQCGSRFSVMNKLPFERENTSHLKSMCSTCAHEYEDILDSRLLSQLNACSDCFPDSFLINHSEIIDDSDQLQYLSTLINDGQVVVVQGIAGYLLLFDHLNKTTIQSLRLKKERPSKPFALMFSDIETIEKYFYCCEVEKNIIISFAAPIVLLKPKAAFKEKASLDQISGVSSMVGVMLAPSAYLYRLCVSNEGALVATSANLNGLPLAYNKITAADLLTNIASEVWYYDREIQFPQDDSVMQVSPFYKYPILLRRSRGLAPSVKTANKFNSEKVVLALGGDLKSTFTLGYQNQLLVSPYQGNLSTFDSQERLKQNINKLLNLCNVQPEIILADEHPMYQNHNLIQDYLFKGIEIKYIKHHQAHACAILGEHQLFDTSEEVLCIVMDGVGYDSPKFIPGAAVFKYQNSILNQLNYYPTFRYIFNDRMSLMPELTLFSILDGEELPGRKFNIDKYMQHNAKQMYASQPLTNSIGRVYDALAALLGFTGSNSFEGEAALWLDEFARDGISTFGVEGPFYKINTSSWKETIQQCWNDLNQGVSKYQVVYSFLHGLALDMVNQACNRKIKHLAVSGGVFQNPVLVDLLIANCEKNHLKLYLHKELSPNDENISFGQYMYHLHIKS